jgi:3',5'-cyclic AMP phosphodiesterase CpdA
MPRDLNGTIWQHVRLIEERGYTWWGWWRAENAFDLNTDYSEAFQSLLDGRTERFVGLFSKSLSRAYVAKVEGVDTHWGRAIATRERAATPDYYNSQAFPAWFRITSIRRIDGREISETSEIDPESSSYQLELLESIFREIGESNGTVLLLDDEVKPALSTLTETSGNRVLHISDLHFGSHHEWHSKFSHHPARITLFNAMRRTLKQHEIDPKSIGVIVVSGDISDEGPAKDRYEPAIKFLNDLFELTGQSSDNLVIVPGNHDVYRHQIDRDEQPFDYSERLYDDRINKGETQYRAFCDSIFGSPAAITRLRRYQTPNNTVNFLQLNSTLPRDQFNKEYGFLGLEPIRLLGMMEELYDEAIDRGDSPIAVAVQHHHLISTVRAEYVPEPGRDPGDIQDPVSTMVDQSNIIDWCTQYKIRLLLHGHQHKVKSRVISSRVDDDHRPGKLYFTEILGAGSAGATWRADNDDMSFNIYDLNGDAIRIRSIALDKGLAPKKALRDYEIQTNGELA